MVEDQAGELELLQMGVFLCLVGHQRKPVRYYEAFLNVRLPMACQGDWWGLFSQYTDAPDEHLKCLEAFEEDHL